VAFAPAATVTGPGAAQPYTAPEQASVKTKVAPVLPVLVRVNACVSEPCPAGALAEPASGVSEAAYTGAGGGGGGLYVYVAVAGELGQFGWSSHMRAASVLVPAASVTVPTEVAEVLPPE
jgi:hypothetical protein